MIAGIVLSGMALYTLVAWILPEYSACTIVLSLAGVTGIIVSVGVTVDSYIVYFERMKDEVRAGRDGALVRRPRVHTARSAPSSPPTSCRSSARSCSTSSPSARCAASRSSSGSRRSSTSCVVVLLHAPAGRRSWRATRSLVRMQGFGIGAGLDAPGVVA